MVPRSVFSARPHLIITPSVSRSCIRATGMLCEMATLKRTENCHQGLATESSPSTSSRLGITSRCDMRKAYAWPNDKDICPLRATRPVATASVAAVHNHLCALVSAPEAGLHHSLPQEFLVHLLPSFVGPRLARRHAMQRAAEPRAEHLLASAEQLFTVLHARGVSARVHALLQAQRVGIGIRAVGDGRGAAWRVCFVG